MVRGSISYIHYIGHLKLEKMILLCHIDRTISHLTLQDMLGTFTYSSGSYTGQYERNKKHGMGKESDTAGNVFEGRLGSNRPQLYNTPARQRIRAIKRIPRPNTSSPSISIYPLLHQV